jgi:hypothetical protein
MAVSLSRRVEALEDERLSLTSQLDSLRKRHANTELLCQLMTEQRGAAPAPGSKEDLAMRAALKSAGYGDTGDSTLSIGSVEGAKKKGLLSALLGKNREAGGSALADPVRVRAMLEDQVLANQTLAAEQERNQAEIRRLRHLLDSAKEERDQTQQANEKLAAAAAAKSKARKSLGPNSTGGAGQGGEAASAMSSAANTPVKPARAT